MSDHVTASAVSPSESGIVAGAGAGSRNSIARLVISYVAEFFYIEESVISENSRFEEDLCADAFSLTDCIDALEEEFTERALGFSIDVKERDELESVKDLIDVICKYVLVA